MISCHRTQRFQYSCICCQGSGLLKHFASNLHVTWKPHITCICKKISKSIGNMFRSRFLLSETTKKYLNYTSIYPCLTFCTTVWSSTYVTNLNRIFLLQKRAVRIITNSDFRAHSEPYYFSV